MSTDAPDPRSQADQNRRQVLYWRLLARLFSPDEHAALETASLGVVEAIGLPARVLDPRSSIDDLVQRHPELGTELDGLLTDEQLDDGGELRRAALATKVLLNVFGTGQGPVSASQLAAWQQDVAWLERACGADPGALRARADSHDMAPAVQQVEADLVRRMKLREILADNTLAAQLTPSMSLIEQLLRDKGNLSGVALANAKRLIRSYIDEVAAVLRTQVEQTTVGDLDRSVPPKRVFRNLDLERTIWKNLVNWSPEDERLYVDRLYYRHTARKTLPTRLIVVVDQSGSMVPAMVNCTILASIFAGLPKVDVHLIAYDTRAIDLTAWVHDPFEVLLRTNLGGGTVGTVAMNLALPKVADPRQTVMVWISDFFDVPELLNDFAAVHRSGVKLIPVGAVGGGGHVSVNPMFRERLADLGTPVLSGHVRKLVAELKRHLT